MAGHGIDPPGTCLLCWQSTAAHSISCPVSRFKRMLRLNPYLDRDKVAARLMAEHRRKAGDKAVESGETAVAPLWRRHRMPVHGPGRTDGLPQGH
jgi:hypothetical protein